MARPIDEKIVAMKLDNSDFVSKAAQTTTIFGKLQNALNKIPGVNLGKTSKEMRDISVATDNVKMGKLAETVQMVAGRFTNLGIVGVTALQNITNRAVDMGMNLAKSLSIEQVTSGFQEYELKMGSIQTILANTSRHGTTLDDVSKSLNKLNDYADQTIYNFGDMTRNIGYFTNAGLKLEESTSMIKGFSNVAAASGTNTQQAAGAAYQLSQALSAGTIRLMDWRSLTNASMGNKNMQEGLIEIAEAMGTLNESGITAAEIQGDFNASLEKNWLSADVMSKYLQIMANDMGEAEMKSLGLSEAQIKVFKEQAKIAEEAATKVRTFSGLMDGLKEAIGSGWAVTFENIFGDFDKATVLWSGLAESLGGFFERSANKRNDFLKAVADRKGIDNIFEGIQNAVKPLMQAFTALGEGFRRVFPPASVFQVVRLTQKFRDFTKGLTMSEKTVGKLTTIFQGVFAVFSTVLTLAKQLGSAILNIVPTGAGGNLLGLIERMAELSISFNQSVKDGNALTSIISGIGKVFGWVGSGVSSILGLSGAIKFDLGNAIDWVKEKLSVVGDYFRQVFGDVDGMDLFGAGSLLGIFLMVKKILGFFDNSGGFLDSFKEMFGGVGEVFDSVKESLNAFATGIKYVNLLTIAVAVGILAVSLKMLEGINGVDLAKGITALAVSLGVMIGGMMLIDKFKVTGGLRASMNLIALAVAVNLMAVALKNISDLNPKELMVGVAGLVGVVLALSGGMILMSKLGGKRLGASSLQLLAIAGAVYVISEAITTLSSIDPKSLAKSVAAIGIVLLELALFLKIATGSKFGPGSAIGIVAIAGALKIMVDAVSGMAKLKVSELKKGLISIAILLGTLAIFSKIAGGPTMLIAGAGIVLIATAVRMLIGPISEFSKMSLKQLAKGLGGMAVALVAVALAGMLASGSIGGAAAIIVMATALNMLMPPIVAFSKMTWGQMIKGFAGLAIGMTLLAVAGLLLTPAVPSMLGFGAALLIMGLAVAAAGIGIAAFGVGLAALATMTATSVTAIVAALALLIKGLMDLIPALVQFVVDLAVALLDGINTLVPKIVEVVLNLIVQILDSITRHLPRIIELGTQFLVNFINGMSIAIPTVIQAIIDYMITMTNAMSTSIRENGPVILDAMSGLMGEILILIIKAGIEVINALFGWIPGVKEATTYIGGTAEQYIRDNFGAEEAGKDKGIEFSDALGGTDGDAKTAGEKLGNAGKDGASSVDIESTGKSFGFGFARGISATEVLGKVTGAAKTLGSWALSKLQEKLDINSPSRESRKLGKFFTEGFGAGIKDDIKHVANSARSIGATALDAVNQFLDGFDMPSNEIHFRAVVDYDTVDINRFGKLSPLQFSPDTSYTSGLVAETKRAQKVQIIQQQETPTPKVNNVEQDDKKPAIIQVVTPERREVARWIVDDVTEFQEFKIATTKQF